MCSLSCDWKWLNAMSDSVTLLSKCLLLIAVDKTFPKDIYITFRIVLDTSSTIYITEVIKKTATLTFILDLVCLVLNLRMLVILIIQAHSWSSQGFLTQIFYAVHIISSAELINCNENVYGSFSFHGWNIAYSFGWNEITSCM